MSADEQITTLENRIFQLEQENKRLHDTVEYLTCKLFGRSSEKTSTLALGQISLFDEAEILADPKAPEPDLKEVQGYRRKKFKGQRMENITAEIDIQSKRRIQIQKELESNDLVKIPYDVVKNTLSNFQKIL